MQNIACVYIYTSLYIYIYFLLFYFSVPSTFIVQMKFYLLRNFFSSMKKFVLQFGACIFATVSEKNHPPH